MNRILRASLLLSALTLVLAACNRAPEAPPPPCPEILVPSETQTLTRFAEGAGQDLTDIVFEANVANFGGFCDTDIDRDDRTGEVEVEMTLLFETTRGPANTSRTGQFTYYVAIADRDEKILARQTFTSEVQFVGNRHKVGAREELTQTIPLGPGQNGEDFVIYIGLQLTADQLEYNRAKLARR